MPDELLLTEEMILERVLERDTLPYQVLVDLERTGQITSAQNWATHMAPGIHWIAPAEYGQAFDDLMKEHDPMRSQAGWTQTPPDGPNYLPAYLHAQLDDRRENMLVTMRARAAAPTPPGAQAALEVDTLLVAIPLAEWDVWVAEATQVRAGA